MKRFLLFVAVATLFAACSKDGVNEISNDRGHAIPSVLYATIDTEDETRIQLDELQKTVWTEGDLVSVFYYCNGNTPFEFKGKTGDRDGKLGVLSLVDGDTEIDKIVSIYPYSEAYTMNTTKKYVSVKLPATQHYLEGSYGVGDNLMAYVGDDDSNLSHKNLCGWIKIQLKGSGIVTKITLKGNDGEQLAGDAKFYYEDFRLETLDQGGLAIGEYIETITLDCGKGVTLDAETPTEFYFVVAPHTFAKGITIEATCSDGTVMTKSTSNMLTVERNHIKPMAALPVDATILVNNKIWYTNGSTTEPTAPNKPTAFGDATIQSNTYDAEKECWVITFDKDVTKIGDYAFYGYQTDCNKLTSVTIPDSVKTIGRSAFNWCTSLTSVTIPDSVTTIGDYAFYSCESLTSVTIGDSVTTIGDWAFYFCTSLTSVTIPDSVTTIGEGAFQYCDSLKEFKGKFAADNGRCLIKDNTIIAYAEASGTTYTIPDSVTMIGEYTFSWCNSLTSVTIPDSVTTIGERAFSYCESLTSVTIGNSVTTIGDYAFLNCSSLTSVTIPDRVTTIGDYAFRYCNSLKTVYCKPTTPPTGGDSMFDDNASERRIYVPASDDDSIINAYKAASYWSRYKDYIFEEGPANNEIWYTNGSTTEPTAPCEPAAFGNATIQSNTYDVEKECWVITFDKDIKEIGNYAFNSCGSLTSVTIGDSVTTIGDYAFRYCESLTSVTIGNGVTTIGEGAFAYCDSLKEFKGKFAADGGRCLIIDGVLNAFALGCGAMQYTIPDSVTTIGSYAFSDCTSFTSVTIPDSVTTIGDWAFSNCRSLTSVTIGDSVTTIGEWAFSRCTSLTSVTIPDSVWTIEGGAFSSCYRLKEFKGKFAADNGRCLIMDNTIIAYAEASGTTYTIPDSVTTIGDSAFYDCYSLISVNIPNSVTTIGDWAFAYCASLTSVTIPESVTTIGEMAFELCSSLTSVTIGNSVKTIGSRAFYYCNRLKTVYCKPTTPPAGGSSMFNYNASDRKIYVPASDDNSIINAYKEAYGWSTYKDYIFEAEPKPANNEIWYTNGSTTAPTAPNNTAAFGSVTIQSNTYDAEKECWVITFDKEVTEIGYRAFYGYQTNCNKLTSVTIPDSVTTIGECAFWCCSSLTSVTIPDNVTTIGISAFYWCGSLTSVTIPDSVTTIGNNAFAWCYSLTSVTIPDSVTTIGSSVFEDCDSLKSVTIPDSVTTIGDYAFYDCDSLTSVTIPDSVTTIGNDAFAGCDSFTSVTIPDSVTTIGMNAFEDCTSLTSVTIGNSVTTIADEAFRCCDNLTSVVIGNSVKTIELRAFSGCDSLTSVTIPDSVTTIGDEAFDSCDSLTSVTMGNSVTTIGYYAFAWCRSLTSVTIPDSVTTIVERAFFYCESLTSVTIGKGVTSFGSGVFAGCTGKLIINSNIPNVSSPKYSPFYNSKFTKVIIGDSVTTIGQYAFYECSSLTSVTIGNSVTKIGDWAFKSCTSLKTVYCKPTTPPKGGYDMFEYNASGRSIYVPASDDDSIIKAYRKTYGWNSYWSYIFESSSL